MTFPHRPARQVAGGNTAAGTQNNKRAHSEGQTQVELPGALRTSRALAWGQVPQTWPRLHHLGDGGRHHLMPPSDGHAPTLPQVRSHPAQGGPKGRARAAPATADLVAGRSLRPH